jgi:hypothetical protein
MPSRLDARLRRLETLALTSDLPAGQGRTALLDYARRHPPAEDYDPATPLTGMALLLQEARQRLAQEPPPGAAPSPTG